MAGMFAIMVLVAMGLSMSAAYFLKGRDTLQRVQADNALTAKINGAKVTVAENRVIVDTFKGYRAVRLVADTLKASEKAVPKKYWRSSGQCFTATAPRSKQECSAVTRLRAELADSQDAELAVAALHSAKETLMSLPVPSEGIGEQAENVLAAGLAVFLELLSTFGFIAASGKSETPLPPVTDTVSRNERIWALYEQKLSQSEIGSIVGLRQPQVSKIIKTLRHEQTVH